MKVIVIGAGIAGLTFALACQNAGIEVKIYEKTKKIKNIGGGILIYPHGLRYLKWMGIDCLMPYYLSIKNFSVGDNHGTLVTKQAYEKLYELIGGEILPIDRSILQQSLLNELNKHSIYLDKYCVNITTDEHSATVIFADGTSDTADIIVGADGIHSTVRNYVNSNHTIEYTDHCWWGGIVDKKSLKNFVDDEVYVALNLKKICFIWPIHHDRFMWYLPIKMSATEIITQQDPMSQLFKLCCNWDDKVTAIIQAPQCVQPFRLSINALAPLANWSRDRVVLIGDAAHAIGPILGQGASQAMEDAFSLIHLLKSISDIPTALRRYENLRKIKATAIYELEKQSTNMMIQDNLTHFDSFIQQLMNVDLATMYQDLIPLVNEEASKSLATAANFNLKH